LLARFNTVEAEEPIKKPGDEGTGLYK